MAFVKPQQRVPGRLFTIFSFIVASIVGFLTLIPVVIVNAIYAYIHKPNFIEKNKKRGEAIKPICLEMGVPSDEYNRIVLNRIDFAKQMALKMGEPDSKHSDESWNTRLALAIVEIYNESQNQTTEYSTTNDDVEFVPGSSQVDSNYQFHTDPIDDETQDEVSPQRWNEYDELMIQQLASIESALERGDAHLLFGTEERGTLSMLCALNKSPIAFMNLALLYVYGIGGARDMDRAEELLKESASQGNFFAYSYLAMIESEIKNNQSAATAYLKLGVKDGDPKAMTDLGVDYMNGHGVPENKNEAVRLWEMAAKSGNRVAERNLRLAGH